MKDVLFLTKKYSGTQEVRLMCGHALFGARVTYGDPLFLTISPSARHSGLVIRLSRYRDCDPAMLYADHCNRMTPPWNKRQHPKLFCDAAGGDAVAFDVPAYELRRMMVARDSWAVMMAFDTTIRYLLARLTGIRMCPICPRCNDTDMPCQTIFGGNMDPMGGSNGLCEATGGLREYQAKDDPHFHGNAHLASVYQHKTLQEIAELIQQEIISLGQLTDYYTALHQEDHCLHDKHVQDEIQLEQQWLNNNKGPEGDRLC